MRTERIQEVRLLIPVLEKTFLLQRLSNRVTFRQMKGQVDAGPKSTNSGGLQLPPCITTFAVLTCRRFAPWPKLGRRHLSWGVLCPWMLAAP
jgi:hypothetical protein